MIKADFFIFKHTEFVSHTNSLKLHYALDEYQFTESFTFDLNLKINPNDPAIIAAFKILHLIAGVSYLKLYPFAKIKLCYALSQFERNFYHKLYANGLAEFAYRNQLDLSEHLIFGDDEQKVKTDNAQLDLTGDELADLTQSEENGFNSVNTNSASDKTKQKAAYHPLVLVGGGKDSLVSIEAIKKLSINSTLFALNPAKPILDCIEKSGLQAMIAKRQLDPLLFQLNAQGAYNGHVPITAIVSCSAYITAIAGGYSDVVTSNEASANEATVIKNGQAINHQYSKSLEFELDFSEFMHAQTRSNTRYFSLLRQLSEMKIVRVFTQTARYDSVFTSCNRAFKIHEAKSKLRWCLDCPKCHFVYLMFAVSGAPKDRLAAIFSGNPLNNLAHLESFRQLAGLTDNKPWECVGEKLESATAIYQLSQQPDSRDWPVIAAIIDEVIRAYSVDVLKSAYQSMMQLRDEHHIPAFYQGCFND